MRCEVLSAEVGIVRPPFLTAIKIIHPESLPVPEGCNYLRLATPPVIPYCLIVQLHQNCYSALSNTAPKECRGGGLLQNNKADKTMKNRRGL